MPMTGRERVLAALDHRPTDRAPADYQAKDEVTTRVKARLGIADTEALLEALQIDMRGIYFNYSQPDSAPGANGMARTMWGIPYDPAVPAAQRRPFFSEDTTVEDILALPKPDAAKLDYSGIRPQLERYHPQYATYGAPWSPFFHEVGWLIGQEDFYVWMHTKPDVVEALIRHVTDYEHEALRRFLDACAGMLDIVYVGNDFGTQRGLFISPDCWNRFIRPPLKGFFDIAREYGCRVMQHSCGAIRELLPAFIEDGVDVIDPVQVRAAGMDLPSLVRDFGGRLSFHGGVDTQQTLPFGTPADVQAEVRGYRDCTRARGGWILCGSQQLMDDIPTDNVLAMYDHAART